MARKNAGTRAWGFDVVVAKNTLVAKISSALPSEQAAIYVLDYTAEEIGEVPLDLHGAPAVWNGTLEPVPPPPATATSGKKSHTFDMPAGTYYVCGALFPDPTEHPETKARIVTVPSS